MAGRIVLVEGDITEQEVDAIVNAANSQLVLGAGVAGAIRAKGGPSIQAECDAIGSIEVGDAAVTGAGDLPARYVIHAAGMPPMGEATAGSIESSFRRSLELANEKGCTSVAVPAIGAGIGGFSTQQCAVLLLEQAQRHLDGETNLTEIRFVLYGEPTFRIFEMTHDSAKIAAQMAKLRRR
jgi:O-acetyl-ADP-ribose deacetylase (regulator of RNase III)